jgi:transmembrane sensor
MTRDDPANSDREPPSSGAALLHGVDWAVRTGVVDQVMLGTLVRVRRRRRRQLAAAGGVAALALACGLWLAAGRSSAPAFRTSTPAIVDMPQRRILPDGSVVELKDGSRISVAFEPSIRCVALVSGEAHFQVAKNKERPFVVVIGNVEVRAVGTAFSVQRGDDSVEVLVTEGRVTLDKVPAGSSHGQGPSSQGVSPAQTIATLDAGNRATIEIAGSAGSSPVLKVESVSASEVSQRLSWRIPRLEFTQTPLGEAIRMINEHSEARLSLADASLENVRISGVLRADHIETLLHLLEAEDGIKAAPRADGGIVLTRGR